MLTLMRRNNDFFKDFFNDFNVGSSNTTVGLMKTDIKETDKNYLLSVEIPGFTKDEVKVSLEDGYLLIETEKKVEKDETDNEGKFIRKERYYGSMKRSYYVGNINFENVKGSFKDGILSIEIPKEVEVIPEKKYLELG